MATISLRRRMSFWFAAGAAILSILFVFFTYFGVRHVVVTQRQSSDLRQSFLNAQVIRGAISNSDSSLNNVLRELDSNTTSVSIVNINGTWISANVANPRTTIPPQMLLIAASHNVSRQVITYNNQPTLLIGIPIPAYHAVFYELDNINDLNRTLELMLLILCASAVATTLAGLAGGWIAARRLTTPLARAAQAAREIAQGNLTTRLPQEFSSTEMAVLTESFNDMVSQLVERLERDARFASDVSHELRSPLTTLATSVAVMRQSRTDLEPEAFAALELLGADVETFQTLVEDLLDMTRNEAGGIYLENVALVELLQQCVRSASRRLGLEEINLSFDPTTTSAFIKVDRRRFERIIANLLENARRYGGGATSLSVSTDGHSAFIDVDDAGPGVPFEERERIFDRFYRGIEASNRTEVRGTGLGLSLVADHIARFHGTVAVLDSPAGGARFRVTVPLSEESPE